MTHDEAIEILDNYHRRSTGFLGCSDKQILEALQWAKECIRVVKAQQGGDLPSVTPQEPRKGHWILTDVEGNKVWHCHCSECGKDPQNYVGGSENWWLMKNNLPKFCPSCGSDNREVENG
jgi:hypothetical protein